MRANASAPGIQRARCRWPSPAAGTGVLASDRTRMNTWPLPRHHDACAIPDAASHWSNASGCAWPRAAARDPASAHSPARARRAARHRCTNKAIGMMQAFINAYPNSSRIADANKIIEKCREKLEEKDYLAAKLYYNLQMYQAAGIAFTNLLNTYPESAKGEEYMLMAVKSYYQFAKLSLSDKQEERYQKVTAEYFDFADRYPESKIIKRS